MMSIHLFTRLRALHTRLETEIAAERARRLPDATRITRLKKFKLAIKDQLSGARPLTASRSFA